MNMIMIMTILTSIIFIQLNNPLTMGLTLFIQTIMICMLTGMMAKSFWFSYILFLVFLGGMLILFMYIISLASNEMFNLLSKSLFMLMIPMITMMIYKTDMFNNFMNMDMIPAPNQELYMDENTVYLNKLYNFPSNMINILLMIYLLITLIVSVKITKMNEGPLRKMN